MSAKQKSQDDQELKQLLEQESKEEKLEYLEEKLELLREEKQKHRRSDKSNRKDDFSGSDFPPPSSGNENSG